MIELLDQTARVLVDIFVIFFMGLAISTFTLMTIFAISQKIRGIIHERKSRNVSNP
ncbi:hypothetical protein [Marispirochaeta aestuarii]|uniref:hypothetical protein n=1 Tax=Marispirochaeta aestuarii TaxID=1963862 RepID=UPI001301A95D|nr:hypothetical protein [Marispirochaeta aestuarii]